VVVTGFVPQALLLPHTDVMLSQCGAGGALGALAHGVPQVCVPLGADQHPNAAAVERVGAGVVVGPHERTVPGVRAAVERVLADPAHRAGARRVAAEVAAMPPAASALQAVLVAVAPGG
jgi:UDP:flavonoid glycosyltransferase YjiC (YdhE family)